MPSAAFEACLHNNPIAKGPFNSTLRVAAFSTPDTNVCIKTRVTDSRVVLWVNFR